MSLKKALKNLLIAYGGSTEGTTLADYINNLAVAKDPLLGLKVDTDIAADEDLLGKVIGDLQENVVVGEDKITGRLKYVTDYTGFSGDPTQQEGYFIALHAEVPDVENVTIKVKNEMQVTLDPDGIYVGLLGDLADQTIEVEASKDGYETVTKKFKLYTLSLDPKPADE